MTRFSVPRKLQPLLSPARYKGAYGGRGSSKSHFFAGQAILRCLSQATRIVCIREVQNSIRDSVRQLLIDKINSHGVGQLFTVLDSEIRGPHGSMIAFRCRASSNPCSLRRGTKGLTGDVAAARVIFSQGRRYSGACHRPPG